MFSFFKPKDNSVLKLKLATEIQALVELFVENRRKMQVVLDSMNADMNCLEIKGEKNFSAAMRITAGLERRIEQLNQLYKTEEEQNLLFGIELAKNPIEIANDAMFKLITEEFSPPIEIQEIAEKIDSLLSEVKVTNKRASFSA